MKTLKKTNTRIGKIEIRTCNESLILDGEHTTMEMICWKRKSDPYCFTLAYWKKDNEGYNLYFVGNLVFQNCDKETFWKLAKKAQKHLDKHFAQQEEE